MGAKGFVGRILHVDLTKAKFLIEEPSPSFYRTYMGGQGIALYHLLKNQKLNCDPLGPDNTLVFSAGLLAGTMSPCAPRYVVCAKSPLTGALGRSDSGGNWGPFLKRAGFDAIVVKGRAKRPVYLWIHEGEAELRSAESLWGKDTGDCQQRIQEELGRKNVSVLQIGPAGENLVRFAAICNNLAHYNGRSGLGAVMGSKNLKAIVVRGDEKVDVENPSRIAEIFRWVSRNWENHPLAGPLGKRGTPATIGAFNSAGALPTRNWDESFFDRAASIGVDELEKELLQGRQGCFACPVRCKRVVACNTESLTIDPKYGGPEYETLASFGSNCGIDDIAVISKANELCNRFTIDTISAGMTISFAMKCFEEGIIGKDQTDGLELRFGNKEVLLPLLEKIARREGIGRTLADGSRAASQVFGQGSERFLLQVKGQELPMHDPRVKSGLGLQYTLSTNGPDHWFAQHDPFFAKENAPGLSSLAPLGLFEPIEATELGPRKVRLIYYSSIFNSVLDLLGACNFGYVVRSIIPLATMQELVSAATGWETSLWELMKAGERAIVMSRYFNAGEGFSRKDDVLPEKFFKPIANGPLAGTGAMDKNAFDRAVQIYYSMAGLDAESGKPNPGKLYELGLWWLCE